MKATGLGWGWKPPIEVRAAIRRGDKRMSELFKAKRLASQKAKFRIAHGT